LPAQWDVGEQVVATSHVYDLNAPFNGGATSAALSATISSDGAFAIESVPAVLESMGSANQSTVAQQLDKRIKVRFTPAEVHRQNQATLTITARWPDGVVETKQIDLVGDARTLLESPSPSNAERIQAASDMKRKVADARADEEAQKLYEADRHLERPPAWAEDKYQDHKDRADREADAIAVAQQDAISTLIAKIGTYKPPPTPLDIWWELAKAAILLGSSLIGGLVVGVIADEIGIALFSAGTRATGFAKGLSATVNSKLQGGITSALNTLKLPSPEVSQPNRRIAFFEAQLSGFEAVASANKDTIASQFIRGRPVLAENPQLAVDSMKAIADGFQQAHPHAKAAQASASATAWLAFKARMELGATKLEDGTLVTNLDKTRTSKHPTPDGFNGLLDLVVDVDHGPPHVAIARAPGMARALVGDIGMMKLKDTSVPVRVFLGWNEPEPTIITRDERGRIRVSGNFHRLAQFTGLDDKITTEAQAERAAHIVVDLAMSRSLNDWGVQIATDDKSSE